jgi:hypothetical protein
MVYKDQLKLTDMSKTTVHCTVWVISGRTGVV